MMIRNCTLLTQHAKVPLLSLQVTRSHELACVSYYFLQLQVPWLVASTRENSSVSQLILWSTSLSEQEWKVIYTGMHRVSTSVLCKFWMLLAEIKQLPYPSLTAVLNLCPVLSIVIIFMYPWFLIHVHGKMGGFPNNKFTFGGGRTAMESVQPTNDYRCLVTMSVFRVLCCMVYIFFVFCKITGNLVKLWWLLTAAAVPLTFNYLEGLGLDKRNPLWLARNRCAWESPV
jgi:hypothetical protein